MMLRKSPFRTLLLIYSLAIVLGVVEFCGGLGKRTVERDIYGDPNSNYPAAMSRLYPGSSDAEYLIGRHDEAVAARNVELRKGGSVEQAMAELDQGLRQAIRHYEQALALGLKSEEGLVYNYALALIRTQADPSQIDKAIAEWRRNFPYSTRRDLSERRQAIERWLRENPSAARRADAAPDRRSGRVSEREGGKDVDPLQVVPEWKPIAGYVGSQACKDCHPKQFDGYQETTHAHALTEVRPEDEPADGEFDHAPSGRRYRITRSDGSLQMAESLLLKDGTEFALTQTPVRYRVGSGNFARTYLRDIGGGLLFESPVTWYESARAWGMTPGFDKPVHRSFSRQVLENCLNCHSGQVSRSTTSDFRLQIVETSIGCERCHGPGEAHSKLRRSAAVVELSDDPVVNPRRLSRTLAESVCQQCHLQADIRVEGHGYRAVDFRPGEALERYSTTYRVKKSDAGITVVGHVEQLKESACYRKSDTLACMTCHNPHRAVSPERRVEHYRSACLECHADRGCKLDLVAREKDAENDCVRCHMPKSATEVPHLAFTHHHIGIHPLSNVATPGGEDDLLICLSDLSPLSDYERERSLKLARLQFLLNRGADFIASKPGQELAIDVGRWLSQLSEGEMDAEAEFLKTQFLFARGDRRGAELVAKGLLQRSDVRSEEEAALREQLGKLEMGRRRFDEALIQFRMLAGIRSQSQDWFHLAICEEQCGHLANAIDALKQSLRLEPSSLDGYRVMIRVTHGSGDLESERRSQDSVRQLNSLRDLTVTPNLGIP